MSKVVDDTGSGMNIQHVQNHSWVKSSACPPASALAGQEAYGTAARTQSGIRIDK